MAKARTFDPSTEFGAREERSLELVSKRQSRRKMLVLTLLGVLLLGLAGAGLAIYASGDEPAPFRTGTSR
jgi:hypothetical protein